MAESSLNAKPKFILGGKKTDGFPELLNLEIDVKFPNDSIQPVVTISDVTLVNEAAQFINDWVAGGLNGSSGGMFESPEAQIQLINKLRNITVFNGVISLEKAKFIDSNEVQVNLVQDNALNGLNRKLEAITFSSMYSQGEITDSDFVNIEYVEVKPQSLIEILITYMILFIMVKELAESIYRAAKLGGDTSGEAISVPPNLQGSAVIFAVSLAIEIIYAAILLLVIIDLGKNLINSLVPIVRTHKGILTKTLLEKAATKLGYDFISPLEELEFETFLPSSQGVDKAITIGVPNESDSGYNAFEMFALTAARYNAKYAIIDNTIHLRWVDDPFWVKNSTYKVPSTNDFSFEHNLSDFKSSIVVAFQDDVSDTWTVDDAEGRVFQTITDITNFQNQKNKEVKGLDETNIPYSLGSRKNELTAIEKALLPVANAIDNLTKAFGDGTNFKSQIKSKVGILKISSSSHSVAKLLYLNGGRMARGHRDNYSAKTLHQKYHNAKRFDTNNFKRQRKIFNDRRVGFGLEDFVNLLNNSYLNNDDGSTGKVTSFKWRIGDDEADISYYLEQPYYKFFKTVEDEPR